MDVLASAAGRLGWSVSVAKDAEKAIELFQTRAHELVIIDRRGLRTDEADTICRYGRLFVDKNNNTYFNLEIYFPFENLIEKYYVSG